MDHNSHFSVMGKLPATSYVRLVDIWLIFGQLIPFVQVFFASGRYYQKNDNTPLLCGLPKVSLTTVSELYNEDDHTVNHHGFSRNVMGEEKGKVGACQNPILNDKTEQSELYFGTKCMTCHMTCIKI